MQMVALTGYVSYFEIQMPTGVTNDSNFIIIFLFTVAFTPMLS